MKTIRILTLLFCGALTMPSCLSGGEEINPLAGTWTLKGISCQNCIDKTQITSTTYSCNDSTCNTYTFHHDGTLTLVESIDGHTKTTTGSYSISGLTVHFYLVDEASSIRTYSYTLTGSMLYLKEIVEEGVGQCGSTTVLSK